MALPQQKFREIVFQLVYSLDFSDTEEEDMTAFMMHQFAVTKKTLKMAQERKRLVLEKKGEIDGKISRASSAYDFERIPRIERNILRLGAYEIFFDDEIPPKVAIAEAVRLARKFATPEGATFVNAILDSLYQSLLAAEIDQQPVSAG